MGSVEFAGLTPDEIFYGLEVGIYFKNDIKDAILSTPTTFTDYVDEIETLAGYETLGNAFVTEGTILPPSDVDEFLSTLADYYRDLHPEWQEGLGTSKPLTFYTEKINPSTKQETDKTPEEIFLEEWSKIPGVQNARIIKWPLLPPIIEYEFLGEKIYEILTDEKLDKFGQEELTIHIFANGYDRSSHCAFFDKNGHFTAIKTFSTTHYDTYNGITESYDHDGTLTSQFVYQDDLEAERAALLSFDEAGILPVRNEETIKHAERNSFKLDYYNNEGRVVLSVQLFYDENDVEQTTIDESEIYFINEDGSAFDPAVLAQNVGTENFVALLPDYLPNWDIYANFVHYLDTATTPPSFDSETMAAIEQYGHRLFDELHKANDTDEISQTQVQDLIQRIEKKYGVVIETHDFTLIKKQDYTAKEANLDELYQSLIDLERKMQQYPPGFFQDACLKKIYLVISLTNPQGEGLGGLRPSGTNAIVINIDDGIDWSFDHELRHLIDNQDHVYWDDYLWGMAAHGGQFEELFVATDQNSSLDTNAPPVGFARLYGKEGLVENGTFSEDQATTAEMLRDSQTYTEMSQRAFTDPELAIKIDLTKAEYFATSQGRFDDHYWQDLAAGRIIDASYWENREERANLSPHEYTNNSAGLTRQYERELEKDAWKNYQLGHYRSARKSLLKLAEMNPDNPSYVQYLAYCEHDLYNYQQAIRYYETAIQLGSRDRFTYVNYETLMKLRFGKRDGSKRVQQCYVKAYANGVMNKHLLNSMAEYYLNQGQVQEAIEVYQYVSVRETDQFTNRFNASVQNSCLYHLLVFLQQHEKEIETDVFNEAVQFCIDHVTWSYPGTTFFAVLKKLDEIGYTEDAHTILTRERETHSDELTLAQALMDSQDNQ